LKRRALWPNLNTQFRRYWYKEPSPIACDGAAGNELIFARYWGNQVELAQDQGELNILTQFITE